MNATLTSKDNDWNAGTTTYWFDVEFSVNDEQYNMVLGLSESGNDKVILDDEGRPIIGVWFEPCVSELQEFVTEEMRLGY